MNLYNDNRHKGVTASIYSTLSSPNVVSVGNGGCIIGLIGAISVEALCISLTDQYDLEVDDEVSVDEEHQVEFVVLCDRIHSMDDLSLISAFCLGMLVGFLLILVFYWMGTIALKHDWSNLYGGLFGGVILGSTIFSSRDSTTLYIALLLLSWTVINYLDPVLLSLHLVVKDITKKISPYL